MTTQLDTTRFSPREIQVLEQIAQGVTYGTIARRLRLSPHTVDTYLRRIRAKTGSANRTQLALLAVTMRQQPSAGSPETSGPAQHPGPPAELHPMRSPSVTSPPRPHNRPLQAGTSQATDPAPAQPAQADRPSAPNPSAATTPAEFVTQLRRLKAWSGEPSLRQLERRTGLPRSTLALALSPHYNRLPPLERVVTLVQACGATPSTTQLWVDNWRRIRVLHCTPSLTLPDETHPCVERRCG